MRRLGMGVALLAVAIVALPAVTAAARGGGFEQRLREAIHTGELSPERADLYRLFRLKAVDRLPAALRDQLAESGVPVRSRAWSVVAQSPTERSGRDATSQLRVLRARLASASEDIRVAAAEVLPSAVRAESDTPSRVAAKDVARRLQNRIVTDNFSVEWGSTLTNEDGSAPPRDDGPVFAGDPAVGGNDVPDVVERWAAYLEASYQVVVDELGFRDALLTTSLVPVYLGNSDPNSTIDDINTSSFFGFTDRIGSGVPYLVVNNDLAAIAGLPGTVPELQPFMKVTAAHEFFHVFHFLYEALLTSAELDADIWWWEASATWMEDEVFDSVNDYHTWFQGAEGWASSVEKGLAPNFNDVDYNVRAYGAVIFAKYLSEHIGGRDSMWRVWDRIRPGLGTPDGMRILDALDDYAVDRGFTGLGQLYLGFSGANAVMDYEEGADYGSVPVRAYSLEVVSNPPAVPVPRYLGATHLKSTSGQIFTDQALWLFGSPRATWGLTAVIDRRNGHRLTLGSLAAGGSVAVALARTGVADTVYAVPSFLSSGQSATSYSTETRSSTALDTDPPEDVFFEEVPGSPKPAGGIDIRWAEPADASAVAGYVVRWRPNGFRSYTGSRTVVAPVTRVEVRGLNVDTYDVQVFAYDIFGNADDTATPISAAVATAGSDATWPPSGDTIPNDLIRGIEFGSPPSGGGGGGGGGGCFLQTLGY